MPRRRKFRRILSSTSGKVGYNSHGAVTSLAELKALESERGNDWFDDRGLDLNRTQAIWVTYDPRYALRYAFSASLFDLPTVKPGEIDEGEWREFKRQMTDPAAHVNKIDLTGSVRILEDGDGGYLHIWPIPK